MAKAKRRGRGVVKGWVVEARNAGKKKARDIADYIEATHGEAVGPTQIYGILHSTKGKRGRPAGSKNGTAKSAAAEVGTGRSAVHLIKSIKSLADQAGGMARLKEVIEAMS